MAPSTALVVASSEPGRTRAAPDEDDVDLPVDLSQLPMIPMAKSLLLVNNFVANTTRFLNHFANDCEERITRVSTSLTRVEIMLAILEAKLDSIPDLDVTESEVQAAGQSISGEAPLQASVEPSIGIDSQDLPSTDDGFGFVPPPPPPPPPSGGDVDAENRMVVGMPPPPPPPPGLPSFDEDGSETSNALVVAPSNELAPAGMFGDDEGFDGPPVLKLKDDPVYAKYFTMRLLENPDLDNDQKLMLDGMDPSILSMDPEGPSPSAGSSSRDSSSAGMPMPPPPPSAPSGPPSGNIGMPFPPPPPPISPTSSTSSRAESLFGSGPTLPPPPPNLFPQPPMPPMPEQDDDDDSSSDDDGIEADAPPPVSAPTFLKLKDDPAFAKYFTMRKLGMPDGVIQHKLMMDGVTLDILSMDPEGPSPNAGTGGGPPPASSSGPPALPPPPQGLPPLPAGRPGLPPPPVAKYDGSDDDFDSDSD